MDVWISEILAWIEEPAAGWAPMGDWAQPMGLNQLPHSTRVRFGDRGLIRAVSREP